MKFRSANKDLPNCIGQAARTGRTALGITQAELAMHVGLSSEFYSRVERGNAVPSLRTLLQLSEVLGISVDFLLGSTGPDDPRMRRVLPPLDPPSVRRVVRRLLTADQVTLRLVTLLLTELHALR